MILRVIGLNQKFDIDQEMNKNIKYFIFIYMIRIKLRLKYIPYIITLMMKLYKKNFKVFSCNYSLFKINLFM